MPITPWIPAISRINNGEDVSAEVVNPIFAQHTQREQHLYEKLASIADKSVLIAYDQPVFLDSPVVVKKNRVIFYKKETTNEGIALAKVEFIVRTGQTSFAAANSTYSIGIIKDMHNDNKQADIYLMGLVEFDANIDDPTDGIMQSSETNQANFDPGPLFLSRTEAGKVTRNPGGVAIYIGYAVNRTKLILAPNVSEFNQFYTTYRYNLLDRPAGIPVFGSAWTVTVPDLTKVGWVGVADLSAAYQALAPVGAKFFYNLPDQSNIEKNTGIIATDRLEQIELAKNLPPNPPNLTLLVVNGIIQEARDAHNTTGSYVVTDIGIWWFDDAAGLAPWAEDIPAKLAVTANAGTDAIALTAHGFILDDIVRFTTTGTLPGNLAVLTDYYVVELTDTDHFKVSTTKGGAVRDITDAGIGTHYINQPYIWKFSKGTDSYRPKMALQFIRINPSIRDTIVTSIKPYNIGSDIIKFYKPDKSAEGLTGDLLARLQLKFAAGTAATSSAKAIKSLSYLETDGKISYVETPIISKLTAGSGITVTQSTVDGADEPGSFIVAAAANNNSGRVNSIEPDGAELLFTGLHSYISMTVPSVLPSSIIGKITLPANVPASDMTFVLLMLGLETLSVTKAVEFEFTYAVTKTGSLLDNTVSTPVSVLFNMPTPYTSKTCFKVGNTTDGIATANLKIPASAFTGGDASVNFKLARKQAALNPLTTTIGIVDIYWKIG